MPVVLTPRQLGNLRSMAEKMVKNLHCQRIFYQPFDDETSKYLRCVQEVLTSYVKQQSEGRRTLRNFSMNLLQDDYRCQTLAVVICDADTDEGLVTELTDDMVLYLIPGFGDHPQRVEPAPIRTR